MKPVKWDLGNVVFGKKLPSSPTFKKSPDQKEDLFGLLPEIKPSFEDEKIPTVQVVHYLFLALITACWLIFPLLGAKDGGIGKLRAVLKAFTYSMRSFAFMLSISAFFGFALMSWGRLDIFQTVAYGPIVVMLLGITGFLALKELYACNGMGKPAKSE